MKVDILLADNVGRSRERPIRAVGGLGEAEDNRAEKRSPIELFTIFGRWRFSNNAMFGGK